MVRDGLVMLNPRKPLFTAVRVELERLIRQGTYPPGSQLPAEEALAQHLGVSRVTLREALRVLEEDGVLARRRGIGTFVNMPVAPIVVHLERNLGISELLQSAEQKREVSHMSVSAETADTYVAGRLQIPDGAPTTCVERIISTGGKSIIFTRDIIPGWVIGRRRLAKHELEGSLYRFLTEVCGQTLVTGIARVRPVKASDAVAAKLNVAHNTLLMVIDQIDWNQDEKPILYSREYFVAQFFEFRVYRRREAPLVDARGDPGRDQRDPGTTGGA
jgi:GntR family transcriptional regulator